MKPDEYKIVAERLEEVFREGRRKKPAPPPAVPVTDVSGRWDVEVSFALGRARHSFWRPAETSFVARIWAPARAAS